METSISYSATTPGHKANLSTTTVNYELQYQNAVFEAINPSIENFTPVLITEMVISIIFLIVSIIVFMKIPEFRNLHGKNLITMSFCLLTAYILLCLDFAIHLNISYSSCYTIAVIIHISSLGFFFWTTVLAFDMWSTITRIVDETFEENEGYWKRYIKYSIFAWTATLLAALPAFIFESVELVPPQSNPYFGRRRCWLSGVNAYTFYFNTPIGIIVMINTFIYVKTMRKIYAIDQLVAYLEGQKQQKRLDLYVRLYLVMGLMWFFEFLPWMTRKYWACGMAAMLMAIYGVIFSAIFILNRRSRRQIKEVFFGIVTEKKKPTYPTVTIPENWNNFNRDHALANEVFTRRNNIFGEQAL